MQDWREIRTLTVAAIACCGLACSSDGDGDGSPAAAPAGAGGGSGATSGSSGAAGSGGGGGASGSGGTAASSSGGSGGAMGSGGAGASSSGAAGTGGAAGGGGAAGESGAGAGGGGSTPIPLKVMSLNIYGHATMPEAAPTYAALVNGLDVDVLGIQEGVQDWQIGGGLPTDYSRSEALEAALGSCWERRYQVFVNSCRGVGFVSHERFDMTDGPNAARTGELAVVSKDGQSFAFIDIHWDHESAAARTANADETATAANEHLGVPTIVLGDFNSSCTSADVSSMASQAGMTLIVDGGIDCIFARDATGSGTTVDASPSDHPGATADLLGP